MSALDVMQHFIEPMKVIFGDPPGDKPEEAVMVYVRPLSRHEGDVLRRAAEHFQQTAKRRTWPMPADVIEVVATMGTRVAAERRINDGTPRLPTDAERDATAKELIVGDMGVEAARDGWVGALFDFCARHLRLPDDRERATVRLQGMSFAAALRRDLDLPMTRKVAEAVMYRHEKLARIANGGG